MMAPPSPPCHGEPPIVFTSIYFRNLNEMANLRFPCWLSETPFPPPRIKGQIGKFLGQTFLKPGLRAPFRQTFLPFFFWAAPPPFLRSVFICPPRDSFTFFFTVSCEWIVHFFTILERKPGMLFDPCSALTQRTSFDFEPTAFGFAPFFCTHLEIFSLFEDRDGLFFFRQPLSHRSSVEVSFSLARFVPFTNAFREKFPDPSFSPPLFLRVILFFLTCRGQIRIPVSFFCFECVRPGPPPPFFRRASHLPFVNGYPFPSNLWHTGSLHRHPLPPHLYFYIWFSFASH